MALAKQLREQKPPEAKDWIQGSKPEAPYPPWRPATGGPSFVHTRLGRPGVRHDRMVRRPGSLLIVKPPGAKANTQGHWLEAPTHPWLVHLLVSRRPRPQRAMPSAHQQLGSRRGPSGTVDSEAKGKTPHKPYPLSESHRQQSRKLRDRKPGPKRVLKHSGSGPAGSRAIPRAPAALLDMSSIPLCRRNSVGSFGRSSVQTPPGHSRNAGTGAHRSEEQLQVSSGSRHVDVLNQADDRELLLHLGRLVYHVHHHVAA